MRDAKDIRAYQAKWRRQQRVKHPEKVRAKARASYAKHRTRVLEKTRLYLEANRDAICDRRRTRYHDQTTETKRARALKTLYGMTLEQYEILFDAQGGLCAICGKESEKRLHVDHVHDETDRIRGLLCGKCNTGIGQLQEDPTILASAIRYLQKD